MARNSFWALIFFIMLTSQGMMRAFAQEPAARATNSQPIPEELRKELALLKKQAETILNEGRAELPGIRPFNQNIRGVYDQWVEKYQTSISRALADANPVQAFLNLWGVSQQMLDFALSEETAKAFGPQKEIVIARSYQINKLVETSAQKELPASTFAEAEVTIEKYARAKPLHDANPTDKSFFDFNAELFSAYTGGKNLVNSIASIPLAPFRATTSLAEGSRSISEIQTTADRFVTVFEGMPQQLTLQFMQVLDRLETNQTAIGQLLTQFESSTKNFHEVLLQADALTSNVQRAVLQASQFVGSSEKSLQQAALTSRDMKDLVDSVQILMDRMKQSSPASQSQSSFEMADLERSATAIRGAASEIHLVLGDIAKMNEPDTSKTHSTEPDETAFKITDYERTAKAIQEGTAELRGLLADVRVATISADGKAKATAVELQTQRIMRDASAQAEGITDHLAWRLAQLILLIFVLSLVLVLAARFRRT